MGSEHQWTDDALMMYYQVVFPRMIGLLWRVAHCSSMLHHSSSSGLFRMYLYVIGSYGFAYGLVKSGICTRCIRRIVLGRCVQNDTKNNERTRQKLPGGESNPAFARDRRVY